MKTWMKAFHIGPLKKPVFTVVSGRGFLLVEMRGFRCPPFGIVSRAVRAVWGHRAQGRGHRPERGSSRPVI
jgi:hypothetical protein